METQIRRLDFSDIAKFFGLRSLYFIAVIYDWRERNYQLLFGIRYLNPNLDLDRLISQLIDYISNQGITGFNEIIILSDPEEEVEYLLDQQIRPYAQSHGGDVILQSVDEVSGLVLVYLHGMCSSCPSALITMSHGVEAMLKEALPWIKSVKATNLSQDPDFGFDW